MRATDLFHMIHEYGALRVGQTKAFVVQTVLALDHVHAKGYVYRDLKPENLLVREDGYLRLTDFGFAKALRPGERAYTVCGTPDYLAPETLRQQGTYCAFPKLMPCMECSQQVLPLHSTTEYKTVCALHNTRLKTDTFPLQQQGCTRAADFWAVGVLLFEMLTGYPPFHGQTHRYVL
jgi:protein kinase A|tara:strand:- start:6259 stop:6789 length:531 start_codon:yes stop_codon:yes gene_type:complete